MTYECTNFHHQIAISIVERKEIHILYLHQQQYHDNEEAEYPQPASDKHIWASHHTREVTLYQQEDE